MFRQLHSAFLTVLFFTCGPAVLAAPIEEAGVDSRAAETRSQDIRAFAAAGTIHQVVASEAHAWLVIDQSSGVEPARTFSPWLLRINADGDVEKSVSLQDISALQGAYNWARTPLVGLPGGGIAMLIHDRQNVAELFEFDRSGELIRKRSTGTILNLVGGTLGLEYQKGHWFVIGSRKILRMDDDLKITHTWATEKDEFMVAYAADQPGLITTVSVREKPDGFHWSVRRLLSGELSSSSPVTAAVSHVRHFLVHVFAPDKTTLIIMPDIEKNTGAWNLIRINALGELENESLRVPQDIRKMYATRVLYRDGKLQFLSVADRQAWHSVIAADDGALMHSQALSLPPGEHRKSVSDVRSDADGEDLYIGINYREAQGSTSIRATSLHVVNQSVPASD